MSLPSHLNQVNWKLFYEKTRFLNYRTLPRRQNKSKIFSGVPTTRNSSTTHRSRRTREGWQRPLILPLFAQGREAMCLSLVHQNPSKTSEKWVILIALQSRYTFYRPQTKRLRSRKIGLHYKIRKGRVQIWGRFSNPWNSNGIGWNHLNLLPWSRILVYLPNTVGKRHKKRSNSFSVTEIYVFEIVLSGSNTGSPHNHGLLTQSVCAADCYFIVNELDLPFASPIAMYR